MPHSLPRISALAASGVSSSASHVCFSRSPQTLPEQRMPTTNEASSRAARLCSVKPGATDTLTSSVIAAALVDGGAQPLSGAGRREGGRRHRG